MEPKQIIRDSYYPKLKRFFWSSDSVHLLGFVIMQYV